MEFIPSILDFHRSDVDKLIKYDPQAAAKPVWTVKDVWYNQTIRLNKYRWSFDPNTVVADGGQERGVLHFNSGPVLAPAPTFPALSTSTDAGDVLLRTLWAQNNSNDITIDVNCSGSNQTHTLCVRLMP
jgi:hypothetical protein